MVAGRLNGWHPEKQKNKEQMNRRSVDPGFSSPARPVCYDKRSNSGITSSVPCSSVGCSLVHHASFFAAVAGSLPVVFFALAGLDLPKEPLKIFPFLVFLSPLPIISI
jgi:hypothetical protein